MKFTNNIIMTLAIAFSLITISQTSLAADNNCVSKAEMTEIASHFKQFQSLAQSDYCFDGSQTSNLLSSIIFMRKTAFEANMKKSSDDLFSGRFATSWYNYFIGRIDEMVVESNCQKGVAAYVYAFGGKQMHVCPMMLTDNFSSLDRASIFMHEARHIDGYPHVTCSKGPRQGIQGACDKKISDGGSYAVTVETYAQLAKYAVDLHPALKAYARAAAVTYADETFETPAQVLRDPQLLIMTNKGDFHGYSIGSDHLENLGQTPALGHIALRAQHLILFPEDKTKTAKYVFANNAGDINQAAGDAALEYNSKTPEQRAEFVDLHVAAQWNAKIYKSKIAFSCSASTEALSEIQFDSGVTAVGILNINGYDRIARSNYVMASNGTIYEFGCTTGSKSFLKPTSIKLDQNYKRIHKIGNTIVGLTTDGHLMEINNGVSKPILTAVDGQVFEIAPRATYTFFDLNIF